MVLCSDIMTVTALPPLPSEAQEKLAPLADVPSLPSDTVTDVDSFSYKGEIASFEPVSTTFPAESMSTASEPVVRMNSSSSAPLSSKAVSDSFSTSLSTWRARSSFTTAVYVTGVAHDTRPNVTATAPNSMSRVMKNTRAVRFSASFLSNTVAHPSHSLDVIALELVPQILDVTVHHALVAVEVVAPELCKQHFPGENPAGRGDERAQ